MTTTTDPTKDGEVIASIHDAIATVQFSHPKGNSLPSALLQKLAAEITEIAGNSGVKVIVLRSQGTGAFCGGASSFRSFMKVDLPAPFGPASAYRRPGENVAVTSSNRIFDPNRIDTAETEIKSAPL